VNVIISKRTTRCKSKHRLTLFGLVLGVALAINPVRAWGTEPYSIEAVILKAPAGLPTDMLEDLDPKGVLLTADAEGLNQRICEIFWVKAVAGRSAAPHGKLLYESLEPGALLGIIHFFPGVDERYREDFNDQKLKPGYYTMRYAVLNNAHGKQADAAEFIFLSPARLDRDRKPVRNMDELLRLSELASHTKQPAILGLAPANLGLRRLPDAKTDDTGNCVLQVKLRIKRIRTDSPPEVVLALIVVTPTKGGEDAS